MKRAKWLKKSIASVLLATMAFTILPFTGMDSFARTDYSMDDYDEIVSTYSIDKSIVGYTTYVSQFEQSYPEDTLTVRAEAVVRYDEGDKAADPVIYTDYEGMQGDSVYTSENSLVEFEVEVQQEGFYNLSLVYYPIAGKNSDIERSIFIDGELPYKEMASIDFYRIWRFDLEEDNLNANGSATYHWERIIRATTTARA